MNTTEFIDLPNNCKLSQTTLLEDIVSLNNLFNTLTNLLSSTKTLEV